MPRGRFRRALGTGTAVGVMLAAGAAGLADAAAGDPADAARRLQRVQHVVVIYQENHSFDNLYGGWPNVDGLKNATTTRSRQVDQNGDPYRCLLQNDVNLASPPLPGRCKNLSPAFESWFVNRPFQIDDFIGPQDTTCPAPGAAGNVLKGTGLPGGCTRDLVHRFYQEQYQIDGGRQDRYVTGSDAVGLVMGTYDTKALPIYAYLRSKGHPGYVISDRFFQAAFGGSFLNHQWLVAAATPTWPGAVADGGADDLHSVVDANGMPTPYPLYTPTIEGTKDAALTVACSSAHPAGLACGDWAVNTIQPPYQPFAPGTPETRRLPPQTAPTIGDRLSDAGVDWAWYSGGWSNADGDVGGPGWTNGTTPGTCTDPDTDAKAVYPNCPSKLFQYHHQPLNYFASFAPGTAARQAHLRDEAEFEALAAGSKAGCELKPVSIIKPVGSENEHPGYASEHEGSDHLVDLLKAVEGSACAKDTMVIVTYDEFGGQWDHVSPPGPGSRTAGPHDEMGPSTRIPALTLAPGLKRPFRVDRVSHDTTSIMATIEHRFGLPPVGPRDAAVNDMRSVFRLK